MLDRPETGPDELDRVVDALRASLDVPFEHAVAMPPQVYVSDAVHRLERERIFARDWHCVGRRDEFAEAGAYCTLDIAGEPVFAIAGKDGTVRAFANICRHRSARLLDGSGRAGRIVCPYHAWTYDLDGRLMNAPFMADDFEPSTCSLPQLAVEIWGGWVYVNLDADAPPLAPRIAGLDTEMANYDLDAYETLFVTEEVWETNWKCLIENFGEAYHVFCAHPKTIEPAMPTRLGRYPPGGEGWFRYEQERVDGVAFDVEKDGRILNKALTPLQRATYPIACVFPGHLMSISEDRLFWLALQPQGVGQVRVRWGVAAYPGAVPQEGRDAHVANIKAMLDRVNAEDRGLVEDIYRNAGSRFAARGRLAPLERSLWEFGQYVARRLGTV